MKILFLCRGNIGRSVFGMNLYNKLTVTNEALSTGTNTGSENESLQELGSCVENVILTMKEEGVDVSQHRRRKVTKEMVQNADIIIDMAEQDTIPDFVKRHPHHIYWKIKNPKGTDLNTHRSIKDEIKKRIIERFQL